MTVVKERLITGLCEASVLLVGRKVDAVAIGLERKRGGDELGVPLKLLGIGDFGGGKLAHGRDVFLDASLLKAGSRKVL